MAMMICGAAIFAVGTFFGAWFFAAGQQLRSSRTREKIQEAILKGFEHQEPNKPNTPSCR